MAQAGISPDRNPIPPRFWWARRIAMTMLLLAAVLVGLRYLALRVASRRLAAQIAQIKGHGQPLMPQDFADQPAPPQQDAGPDLLAAMKMFKVPSQHQQSWNQIPHFAPST